ncbi:hypothetical protein [uncultured Bacteroides sp.]|uniref:hypothetical protein n=1 Tax=uncultured Bacteroides sp. TaxID=162156 RepID=UPI0025CBAC12|nr:hypothetical protein [uncultured Bacteroides sp.]
MKKYRLKKEAVPFFADKLSTKILDWDIWQQYQVDDKALEEVEEAYIDYGHKTSDKSADLSGWKNGKGSELRFTIKFPSMNYYEHDKFTKGKMVRDLMNRLQGEVNSFLMDFYNEEKEE